MIHPRKWLALSLAVAALALTLTACSGSVSIGDTGSSPSSDGGTTTSTKTYTNDKYGFTVTYPGRLTQGEATAGTSTGSSLLDMAFADTDGPVVSGKYVDVLQVAVYGLARTLKPTEVPQLQSELQGVVDQLMSTLEGAKVEQDLSSVTVNGIPGFGCKYTFTEGGKELTAVAYFLFKGKYEYQLTAQAVSADWDSIKGDFQGAVQSFTAM